MSVKLNAQPNPDCDPSQGPCEMWLPGVYNVTFGKLSVCVRVCMKCVLCISLTLSVSSVAICNGECGSKHPHSKVYDTASTKFTITGSGK